MSTTLITRRGFTQGAAGVAASALTFNYIPKRVWGANDRIQLAGIGVGGKGAGEVRDLTSAGGKFVALCDVDMKRAGGTIRKHPDAKVFTDFREMLEKAGDEIDAVTVSTPDHLHYVAAAMAISMGKHAYVQKPLTHSVFEARSLTMLAKKHKVATQMGNQAHAGEPIRRGVELIRAGIIGPVREVHAWTNRPIWPQGMAERPKPEQPPESLDWNLWLGPAPQRPYSSQYLPFKWRGWWDFGTGALGDMACHIMDMAYWALDLGSPTAVSAESGGNTPESPPLWSTIEYQFPARQQAGGGDSGASTGPKAAVEQPPVKYMWYDGRKDGKQNAPNDLLKAFGKQDARRWDMILVGDKGKMLFQRGSTKMLFDTPHDAEAFAQDVPKTIRRVPNEDAEFLEMCRGGAKAESSFDYSGPLTEMVLLGNVAIRTGKPLKWDTRTLSCPGTPEADQYIRRAYRPGWEKFGPQLADLGASLRA